MTTTIMIYDGSKQMCEDTPLVSFQVKGKRISQKKLDEMFASASKTLNVSEKKLAYDKI